MGMTLWIHTLEGRSMSKDSEDHSLMHRFADQLDALCAARGLPLLSSYFDHTDLNFCLEDEFGDDADEDADDEVDRDEDDEPATDPETGLGYGIDDMQWFDAAAGLHVLTQLRDALGAGALPTLTPAQRKGLLEELDHGLAVLEAPARRGARFHLAVIL